MTFGSLIKAVSKTEQPFRVAFNVPCIEHRVFSIPLLSRPRGGQQILTRPSQMASTWIDRRIQDGHMHVCWTSQGPKSINFFYFPSRQVWLYQPPELSTCLPLHYTPPDNSQGIRCLSGAASRNQTFNYHYYRQEGSIPGMI